jgi:hypothetical protein
MPWNELEFVSWRQFHRMAPSIMRLEISRLGDLIRQSGADLDLRNALVRVRYELMEFLVDVQNCSDGNLSSGVTEHLDAAIVNLPLDQVEPGSDFHVSLRYILDRLRSIQQRIDFIYV